MKVTTFRAFDNPTLEEVEKLLKEKLGNKYELKLSRKSTHLAGKLITGSTTDAITVIKNAYHRTKVNVTTIDDASSNTGKHTSIYFSEATLAGWLLLLHNQAGLLGRLIIRLIYGNSDAFYEEIDSIIKTNIKGEEETKEVGLGTLFKKKNKTNLK
ncbi:hypothetical protein FIA58_006400 [Flavobacterium jejuense]|uniref:Uncharacterized protein n=1 Tax=Flavobacterium jejuense TaxID=1544455 RepID=A0ABX0IND1_9FLAO|nr:hypothetical protein [Flavobacterium jejuense]NHN25304.1 hypothetical protein [Flavobacterium jejuense]